MKSVPAAVCLSMKLCIWDITHARVIYGFQVFFCTFVRPEMFPCLVEFFHFRRPRAGNGFPVPHSFVSVRIQHIMQELPDHRDESVVVRKFRLHISG